MRVRLAHDDTGGPLVFNLTANVFGTLLRWCSARRVATSKLVASSSCCDACVVGLRVFLALVPALFVEPTSNVCCLVSSASSVCAALVPSAPGAPVAVRGDTTVRSCLSAVAGCRCRLVMLR